MASSDAPALPAPTLLDAGRHAIAAGCPLVEDEQRLAAQPAGARRRAAAAGVNLDSDNTDVLDAHPHEPLAHYLSLHSSPSLRKHASRWAAASNVWGDGILRRLGLGHSFLQRWSSGKALGTTPALRAAERKRALAYATHYKGTALAWSLLGLMQQRTAEEKDETERQKAFSEIAVGSEAFGDVGRYERARCLLRAGDNRASAAFAALWAEARKAGRTAGRGCRFPRGDGR